MGGMFLLMHGVWITPNLPKTLPSLIGTILFVFPSLFVFLKFSSEEKNKTKRTPDLSETHKQPDETQVDLKNN